MNRIYAAIGTTKQSVHQRLDRKLRKLEVTATLEPLIAEIREEHPTMSLRRIYGILSPPFIGRDAFEQHFKEDYAVVKERNFKRTTDSSGVKRFDNLIRDFELTCINQVWVSDITYYELQGKFYYLTFMMDLYSRRIIGYSASRSLLTEDTTIPALQMAVNNRGIMDLSKTIIHSDSGGQYYSKTFISLTGKIGLRNSMCKEVYENPHAERINGIIKNNYLKCYRPEDFNQLKQMLKRAVDNYNNGKPHRSLDEVTPVFFEQNKSNLKQVNNRLKMVNAIQA